MNILKLVSVSALLSISMTSFASNWVVDNAHSELSFISTKKTNIAEVHQFNKLSGQLDAKGNFTLAIDLTSVNTHNPLRDDRMKKFLFNVDKFAQANLSAKIDPSELDAISEGASQRLQLEGTLNLHGVDKKIPLDIIVTRLVGAKFSATSIKPIILNVDDFSLVTGVEKLRELAGLPSISHAVPVSFYITLNLKK